MRLWRASYNSWDDFEQVKNAVTPSCLHGDVPSPPHNYGLRAISSQVFFAHNTLFFLIQLIDGVEVRHVGQQDAHDVACLRHSATLGTRLCKRDMTLLVKEPLSEWFTGNILWITLVLLFRGILRPFWTMLLTNSFLSIVCWPTTVSLIFQLVAEHKSRLLCIYLWDALFQSDILECRKIERQSFTFVGNPARPDYRQTTYRPAASAYGRVSYIVAEVQSSQKGRSGRMFCFK